MDTRYLMRMLRGYGITFLIIQGCTLYFWHVAGELGIVLGPAIAGASALGSYSGLRNRRRKSRQECNIIIGN